MVIHLPKEVRSASSAGRLPGRRDARKGVRRPPDEAASPVPPAVLAVRRSGHRRPRGRFLSPGRRALADPDCPGRRDSEWRHIVAGHARRRIPRVGRARLRPALRPDHPHDLAGPAGHVRPANGNLRQAPAARPALLRQESGGPPHDPHHERRRDTERALRLRRRRRIRRPLHARVHPERHAHHGLEARADHLQRAPVRGAHGLSLSDEAPHRLPRHPRTASAHQRVPPRTHHGDDGGQTLQPGGARRATSRRNQPGLPRGSSPLNHLLRALFPRHRTLHRHRAGADHLEGGRHSVSRCANRGRVGRFYPVCPTFFSAHPGSF